MYKKKYIHYKAKYLFLKTKIENSNNPVEYHHGHLKSAELGVKNNENNEEFKNPSHWLESMREIANAKLGGGDVMDNLNYIKDYLKLDLKENNIENVIQNLEEGGDIDATMDEIEKTYCDSNSMWGSEDIKISSYTVVFEEIQRLIIKFKELVNLSNEKTYILVPGDSGYRICKVVELLINNKDKFEFIFFPISGLPPRSSENNKSMVAYVERLTTHIPKESKIILYDKKHTGKSEEWFNDTLAGLKFKNVSFEEMGFYAGKIRGMVEAKQEDRCQPAYKDAGKEIVDIDNTTCKYVILFLYYYSKDKQFQNRSIEKNARIEWIKTKVIEILRHIDHSDNLEPIKYLINELNEITDKSWHQYLNSNTLFANLPTFERQNILTYLLKNEHLSASEALTYAVKRNISKYVQFLLNLKIGWDDQTKFKPTIEEIAKCKWFEWSDPQICTDINIIRDIISKLNNELCAYFFIQAAKNDNLVLLHYLKEESYCKFDYLVVDEYNGMNALMYAVKHGDKRMVDFLLQFKFDIDSHVMSYAYDIKDNPCKDSILRALQASKASSTPQRDSDASSVDNIDNNNNIYLDDDDDDDKEYIYSDGEYDNYYEGDDDDL